jgi:hypothetical protein
MLNNRGAEIQAENVKGKKAMFEIERIPMERKPENRSLNWKPPDEGWQSLSVDGSFVKETKQASWGVVIRGHLGQIKITAWWIIKECSSAEMAEALACLEGVKQTINMVGTGLIIESDCASVIKKVSSWEKDRSQTSSVSTDIHRLLTLLPAYKV